MFHRHRLIIILLLVVGISITGLMRLRFETNILEVLPKNMPCVEALKVSQEQFGNDQQVVVLLQIPHPEHGQNCLSTMNHVLQ